MNSVLALAIKRQGIPKRLFTASALLGLWCFFLWDAFGADRSFALFADNEFFLGPILSSMSAVLSNGEWPLRMDTILGGVSLYNLPQLSVFYPFYFIVSPIFAGPVDVMYSMHWIVLIHILIFEVNMYIFLRVIGNSRIASLVGAVLVAFSANSFSYAGWINIVAPYSWLPLYLAGIIGVLKHPRSIGYSAMALGAIVLLTLASPAQPLIHAIFLTVVFMLAFWRHQSRIGEANQLLHPFSRICIVAAIALLLVSPVMLPALLDLKNMIRWIGPFPPVVGNGRIPFEAFLIDQLSIAELGGVFFKFQAHAVGQQFVGVVTIALASVALIKPNKTWIIMAVIFIAAYSLISATGSNLGLAYVNHIIPILNKIREPSRFLVLFQFAVGVLASIGIDEIRKAVSNAENQHHSRHLWITLIGVGLIAVVVSIFVQDRIVSGLPSYIPLVVLTVLILMTWFATRIDFRAREIMVASTWGATALIMLAIEIPWTPPPVSSSQYLQEDTLAIDSAIESVAKLDPDREYRVIFDGGIHKQYAAMLASYHGVRTLNAYINPAPVRQFEELYYHGPRKDNYFRVLGAKFLICDECAEESTKKYNYIHRIDGYDIYETQDVLPRSYIVQRVDGVFHDLGDFVNKSNGLDLTRKVLFVEPGAEPGLNLKNENEDEDNCISREEVRTNNRSRFIVQCKAPGVLVMNEFFDTAWKATVDGLKVTNLRVNGNQIGIPFPAGSHVIELRYLPRIFQVSLVLMGIGFFILILVFVAKRKKSIMMKHQASC